MLNPQDGEIRKELSNKLKKARKKSYLTQAKVAAKARIHDNYYARVERGEVNPSYGIVVRPIKTFNLKPSKILS